MAKKTAKKRNVGAEIGAGAAVAAALAIAGGYVLWEKMGKQRQKKVKTWVAKARKDAVQKLAAAKKMGEAEYKRIVDAAVKKYASGGITKIELTKVAADLKSEWKNIQGHAQAIAKQIQKQRGAMKKPVAKPAARKKKTVARK